MPEALTYERIKSSTLVMTYCFLAQSNDCYIPVLPKLDTGFLSVRLMKDVAQTSQFFLVTSRNDSNSLAH